MKKILLALAFLVGSIASAAAACTSPAVMHDFPGTSFNMSLATVPDGNCGSNVALPTWAGGTLGAMANYGTSPGAVLVPGINGFITGSIPEGAVGDAAWVSGNGSLIAIAKAIAGNTAAAVPAGTARIGYTSDDPCTQLTKTNLAIGSATGTTQLVAASGSTQVYVCSFSLIAAATAVVNLVGGTGATCTTGTPVAALGSTTAANGMSLAANGGLTFGNGGATVVRTTTAGHGLCLIQSGTTALAGNITYVQQ